MAIYADANERRIALMKIPPEKFLIIYGTLAPKQLKRAVKMFALTPYPDFLPDSEFVVEHTSSRISPNAYTVIASCDVLSDPELRLIFGECRHVKTIDIELVSKHIPPAKKEELMRLLKNMVPPNVYSELVKKDDGTLPARLLIYGNSLKAHIEKCLSTAHPTKCIQLNLSAELSYGKTFIYSCNNIMIPLPHTSITIVGESENGTVLIKASAGEIAISKKDPSTPVLFLYDMLKEYSKAI